MRKSLAYYAERGMIAARLTRLDETMQADHVTRLAGESLSQEAEDDRRDGVRAFDAGYQAECIRFDAARAAETRAGHPDAGKPIRALLCSCCGARTYGRQFHNRDTGYGLCPQCVGFAAVRSDAFDRSYGVKGIHFAIPGRP